MSDIESRPQITKVWAKNFRSIEYAELELGPLTVLVGPNASGKSNLLDVLRFIADSVSDDLDTAVTERGGINSIRRRSARDRVYDLELGLQFENNDSIIGYQFSIANRKGSEYQVKKEYAKLEPKNQVQKSIEIEIRNGRLTIPQRKLESVRFDTTDLGMLEEALRRLRVKAGEASEDVFSSLIQALLAFEEHASHMHFYQIFPNTLRDPQKMSSSYHLSERGENLASVLRDMIQRRSLYLQELKEALGYVVPSIRDIKVTRLASFLVVQLNHEGARNKGHDMWLDLSLEADGTLRLLGLLVALLQDPPPYLIAIEEPELTIHPGALAVLADIILEASLRTQVLITTHSPDLIDRLPIQSIRAVTAEDGMTETGAVAEEQREAVRKGLFSPGELHRMEGLHVGTKES